MERAALVTAPLSNPITRAGQHQAPIRAGIEASKVTMEMMSPHLSRSDFFFSSSATTELIFSLASNGLRSTTFGG